MTVCWCVKSLPKKVKLAEGEVLVASVFDLFVANYGLDRGLGDPNSAKSYDEGLPYTPAWQKKSPVFPRITSSR